MENGLTIGFVGNPNCGKTTLFNGLTGLNQKTGNWPGVTVERMEGSFWFKEQELKLIDLPGTYSLSSYTLEEQVTKASIMDGTVDVVVNVLDATALERSLYLTYQLLALERPLVLALNMMDIVGQRGILIDIEALSKRLGGIPIIPISARKQEGLEALIEQALLVRGLWQKQKSGLKFQDNIYQEIERTITECVKASKAVGEEQHSITNQLDKILLHRWLGMPIFLLIMAVVFLFTFWAGDIIKLWLEVLVVVFADFAEAYLIQIGVSTWLVSLVVDGIIAGVGGILTFLPNIFFLFIALGFLESCGYMARVAYLMNEMMSFAGLSGKAFLPMLLGFGCTVPAVMATRTLTSLEERKKTIFVLPFMSCSARIPIYILFSSIFFAEKAIFAAFSMYVIGLFIAILTAAIYSTFVKTRQPSALLIELPEYRWPDWKGLGIYVWDKVKEYLTKAGTVIFVAAVALWLLLNYNLQGPVTNISHSFGADISKQLVPVFTPAGLGHWQMIAALISGLSAKEVVVSSLYILYDVSSESTLAALLMADGFTRVNGYAFMIFCLLYSPCIAAISTVQKELQSVRWTVGMVFFQMMIAWLGAVIVYQVGTALMIYF